jgi:hypothetical protein
MPAVARISGSLFMLTPVVRLYFVNRFKSIESPIAL